MIKVAIDKIFQAKRELLVKLSDTCIKKIKRNYPGKEVERE